jgi:hypothetical protein
MSTIPEEVTNIVNRLPYDKQQQILDYARSLEQSVPAPMSPLPPGKPARDLLNFHPMLSHEDVEAMKRAIDEGCETIEPDEN